VASPRRQWWGGGKTPWGLGATTAVGNITVGIMVIMVDIMVGTMANINLHL